MTSYRSSAVLLLGMLTVVPALAPAQGHHTAEPTAASSAGIVTELPLKHVGKPTTAALTPADLMTRLYIYADDSLMGRDVGTEYHIKATSYIENEVRKLGLLPGGDNGTYFQNLPLYTYYADSASTLRAGGETLGRGTDYFPLALAERRLALDGMPVVYGGAAGDSTTWISSDDAAGKLVVLTLAPNANAMRNALFPPSSRFGRAAGILVASLDRFPANALRYYTRHTALIEQGAPPAGPTTVFVTPRVAALVFGPLEGLKPGTAGKPLGGTIITHEEQAPGRNVVAVLPGTDPALKGQFVAIGAHNDHIGFNDHPVDHDSIRAVGMVARVQGADSPAPTSFTPEQASRIRTITDSLHRLHGVRRDSIYNGADDDGSGSMTVLEIAEAFAKGKAKPKRSLIFVWHAAEEKGLWGSEYFTDHPTVSRDSIVAQLNMDMVGRGAATDVTGEIKDGGLAHGGPGYVQLVGSRRLSTELGDLIERVNGTSKLGLNFDYSQDANGHQQNIYCRSDHYSYARYGIPVVFVTTGGHADYHQVTDEPQYLDYARMAKVGTLVHDAALTVANLDHRIVVDKTKPDPKGRCVQ
jgi:hypothetical protein